MYQRSPASAESLISLHSLYVTQDLANVAHWMARARALRTEGDLAMVRTMVHAARGAWRTARRSQAIVARLQAGLL